MHPSTGEALGWWAGRRERRHRRSGERLADHAQHLCDERLRYGALLTRQGQRKGQPWVLAFGATRAWVLLGGRNHPDRAEEVIAELPRARVSIGEAAGKERVLGFVPVRLVELGLPNGDRELMRPDTLSLQAMHVLNTLPTEPAYLVDDGGLERVEPDGRGFRVAWETLRQVTLVRPTAESWEAVQFTGQDAELVVPFEAMREAIWERVRKLPGTNAAIVDAAAWRTGGGDGQVWWRGMDTDPDSVP